MKKYLAWLGSVGMVLFLVQGLAVAAERMQLKSAIPVETEEDEEEIVVQAFFHDWQDHLDAPSIELEINPQYGFTKDGDDEGNFSLLDLELEIFPFDNWELEFEWVALQSHDEEDESEEEGIGDLEVELEYRFLHLLNPVVDARLGFEYKEPLADVSDGLSDGVREYVPYLTARTRVGDLHLMGHAAFAFKERVVRGDEDDEEGEEDGHELDKETFEYGLIAVYPINGWRPMLELSGETNEFDGGSENEVYVVPELRYQWKDPLPHFGAIELALGVPLGLTHDADDMQVRFQVVTELELWEGAGAKSYGHHNFFKSLFGRGD